PQRRRRAGHGPRAGRAAACAAAHRAGTRPRAPAPQRAAHARPRPAAPRRRVHRRAGPRRAASAHARARVRAAAAARPRPRDPHSAAWRRQCLSGGRPRPAHRKNRPVTLSPALQTVALLVASNVFMTFAWYGHLKHQASTPWLVAALVSWGIALF